MLDAPTTALGAVYLLADHLDAALAAGEDLLATRLPALADLDQIEDAAERELARFVARLARLETALVGRVLQARRRLTELPRHDADVRPVAHLFVAGTALVEDVVAELGSAAEGRFDTGLDRLPFLRRRGLLATDAAALPLYDTLDVSDTFLIYGRIALGPLLDLVAKLLDVLDDRYDLYGERSRATADLVSKVAAPATDDAAEADAEVERATGSAGNGPRTDRADIGSGASPAKTAPDAEEVPQSLTPGSLAAALEQLEKSREAATSETG